MTSPSASFASSVPASDNRAASAPPPAEPRARLEPVSPPCSLGSGVPVAPGFRCREERAGCGPLLTVVAVVAPGVVVGVDHGALPAPRPSLCRRLWQDGGLASRRLFIDSRQIHARPRRPTDPGGPREPGAGRAALPRTARPAPAVPRECGGRNRPGQRRECPARGKGCHRLPGRWEYRKVRMSSTRHGQCRNSFQIQVK